MAINYYFDIISGKRRGLFSFFVNCLLFIISLFYGFIVRLRYFFWAKGYFKKNHLSVPVISIGNITLGGTGKTPFVIWLARFLISENKRVGILTRGYGRKKYSRQFDYQVYGDEPVLIKNLLASAFVAVDSDRYRAGLILEKEIQPNVFLLDDGFQHVSLYRNLDIVIIDALNPFGYKKIFPRGLLREDLKNLKRADIFIISKVDLIPDYKKNEIKDFLGQINPSADIFEVIYKVTGFNSLQNNNVSIEKIQGKRCLAFSSIGNPDGFLKLLAKNNLSVLEHLVFPDHYVFKSEDIREIFSKAAGLNANFIVTTEKDKIRIKDLIPDDMKIDVLFCLIELRMVEGEEIFKEKIRKLIS